MYVYLFSRIKAATPVGQRPDWAMRKSILTLLAALLVTAAPSISLAQSSGGDFEATKSTIDNGGGTSSGGDFSLTGSIGQHDAATQSSNGGDFSLASGFWASAQPPQNTIFSDGFENP